MKILKLTLKRKWFDLILSGEKKEEYREIKDYWLKRLVDKNIFIDAISFEHWLDNLPEHLTFQHVVNQFDAIHFYNGAYYSDKLPNFLIECKGIEIAKGKTHWGAEPHEKYFVIKLGEILNESKISTPLI